MSYCLVSWCQNKSHESHPAKVISLGWLLLSTELCEEKWYMKEIEMIETSGRLFRSKIPCVCQVSTSTCHSWLIWTFPQRQTLIFPQTWSWKLLPVVFTRAFARWVVDFNSSHCAFPIWLSYCKYLESVSSFEWWDTVLLRHGLCLEICCIT